MNWYAVTTRPNCEAKAAAELRREKVTVWFPRRNVGVIKHTRGKAKRVWAEKPAYARYLFVRLPSTWFWKVRLAKCRLVALDPSPDDDLPAQPTRIPEAVMTILMAGFDDTGLALAKAETARARYQAMQSVRFTSGVLQDALAKVVSDDGGEQIRVLLKILGSEREIRVPAAALEAA